MKIRKIVAIEENISNRGVITIHKENSTNAATDYWVESLLLLGKLGAKKILFFTVIEISIRDICNDYDTDVEFRVEEYLFNRREEMRGKC